MSVIGMEAVISALEKIPSPEGCGCKARKEKLIEFMRTGKLPGRQPSLRVVNLQPPTNEDMNYE